MTGFSGETTVERDVGTCLMCGSPDLTEAFRLEVEHGRFDSPYHECKECRSLQLSRVERGPPPAVAGIGDFDVGSVQRSILTALLVRALRYSRLLRRSARCLDFGAGLGLLVRLLRDQGIDAWGVDKFQRMAACESFQIEPDAPRGPFDFVILLEVFEHLLKPFEELSAITSTMGPHGMLLIHSELYDARIHGRDWTYLHPEWGGHVNFASREGMERMAARLGFRALFLPVGYCLLVRPGAFRAVQGLVASALFLTNIAAARAIGQCNSRHAGADSQMIEAANLRKLDRTGAGRG